MSKRLKSVELELFGVERTFEFDPPVKVQGDDEFVVGNEVLESVTSREIELVSSGISSASVTVSYTYEVRGEVEVDLEFYDALEDEDAIRDAIESGDMDDVYDAIQADLERNFDSSDAQIDNVDINGAYDENGDEWEED